MNTVKYNPFRPFKPMQINHLIDDVAGRSISDFLGSEFVSATPSVNVIEHDTGYDIEVAAPGLAKEDFQVELDKDHLVISADKKTETEQTTDEEIKGKVTRREFNYSSFKRRFHLSDDIGRKEINARYKDGVLTITLLKKEEDKDVKRSIKIK